MLDVLVVDVQKSFPFLFSKCHLSLDTKWFQTSRYQAPNMDFFDTDDKVCFYTGLPSMEVLKVVFEHVSSHVTRQTQSLNRFQEFIILLMKLRLNAPLQDLAYRFVDKRQPVQSLRRKPKEPKRKQPKLEEPKRKISGQENVLRLAKKWK